MRGGGVDRLELVVGRPAIRRSAGATNTSKETMALTGLPGSVKTGVSSSPRTPNPCGLPGCIATWSKRHRPHPGQHLLDRVVGAGADPAGGDDQRRRAAAARSRVSRNRRGVVAHHRGTRNGTAPGSRRAAVSMTRVAVHDLPEARPGARARPARRRWRARRPAGCGCTTHPGAPRPRRAGRSARARAACRRAAPRRRRARPRRPRARAGRRRRPGGSATCASPPSVDSTGTTASAPRGSGAPVMIRIDCPGARLSALVLPGGDVADDRQRRPVRPRWRRPRRPPGPRSRPWPSWSKPGRSTSLATSSASTQPCASSSPMSMRGSRRTVARMRARCCSTVITTSAAPPRRRSRRATSQKSGAELAVLAGQPDDGLEVVQPVAGVVAAAARRRRRGRRRRWSGRRPAPAARRSAGSRRRGRAGCWRGCRRSTGSST